MRYWLDRNQLIVITSKNILFGTYSQDQLKEFVSQLKEDVIPDKLVGIPLQFIRQIESPTKRPVLSFVLRKDNVEQIKFTDGVVQNSVFQYISANFSEFEPVRAKNNRLANNYWRAMAGLALLFVSIYIMDPNQTSVSLKTRILLGLAILVDKYLNQEIFYLIIAATFIWRTIVFIRDINACKKTLVLKRKFNPPTYYFTL